jgi:perosamine synthetase
MAIRKTRRGRARLRIIVLPMAPRTRFQPPARSPLDRHAVASGVRSAISRRAAQASRTEVLGLLEQTYPGRTIVLTDSGTSALSLALGIGRADAGRPVAIPAYGCFDLATAVDGAAVPFVLYDVDPATLGPDPASLRRALERGADRVVIAHLYGVPVDLTRIAPIVRDAGAHIIDDAAQGAGGSVAGSPLGACGDLGVLSFGRGKGITGGSGGALILRDSLGPAKGELAAAAGGIATLRAIVTITAQWMLARPTLFAIPASIPVLGLGETVYRPPHHPAAITPIALGVLSRTLHLAPAEAEHRRRIASRLRSRWRKGVLDAPAIPPDAVPGFLRCPAVASASAAVAGAAPDARRLGIMPGYPKALADLEGFGARRLNHEEPLEGARQLARRLLTFPVHGAMAERDVDAIEAWIDRLA